MLWFFNRYDNDSQKRFEDEERVDLSNFWQLRTSLHGILASCELMEESKLNEAQAELVKTIQGCGTSLIISIINSVLDFAKLESEKQDYVEDPINQRN
ncbi:unnamed protein product [Rhizophagus irregularis]|nr:unnamed protein product [Rhizophagus irregularis]